MTRWSAQEILRIEFDYSVVGVTIEQRTWVSDIPNPEEYVVEVYEGNIKSNSTDRSVVS